MDKLEKIIILFFALFVGLCLGYYWRMHHEIKNWSKWWKEAKIEALKEITSPSNGVIMDIENKWLVIKRKDGSVVIREK